MTTKRNRTQQLEQESRELQPEQLLCIGALLEGLSDEAAAARAGVSRATVQRWKHTDALFVAALNAEIQAQWREQSQRLRSLRAEAVAVIAAALASDDEKLKVSTAWKLLDSLQPPTGSTTEAGVRSDWNSAALFADLLTV